MPTFHDFFKSLDSGDSQSKSHADAAAQATQSFEAEAKRRLAELNAVAQTYAEELRQRGYKAGAEVANQFLQFTLELPTGGTWALSLSKGDYGDKLVFVTRFPDEDKPGITHTATSGSGYAPNQLSDEIFERELQGFISSFRIVQQRRGRPRP